MPDLKYAIVNKYRRKGKVVRITTKVIFGNEEEVKKALEQSPVSNSINTAFAERNNLTLRNSNKRLARKTNGFSKDKEYLQYQLDLFFGHYHFVRPHGGLRIKKLEGKRRWIQRTPLMAAGITDHIWSFVELLSFRLPP